MRLAGGGPEVAWKVEIGAVGRVVAGHASVCINGQGIYPRIVRMSLQGAVAGLALNGLELSDMSPLDGSKATGLGESCAVT
jgi:hypothetical protein